MAVLQCMHPHLVQMRQSTLRVAFWEMGRQVLISRAPHNFAIDMGTLTQSIHHFYTSKYDFRAWFSLVKLQNVILILQKKINQSVSQIFLQLVDSHSAKLTCSIYHLGNSCRPESGKIGLSWYVLYGKCAIQMHYYYYYYYVVQGL